MQGRRLYRESVYVHEDEMKAVEAESRRKRCSKAEVLRRAVRAYFKIETEASSWQVAATAGR